MASNPPVGQFAPFSQESEEAVIGAVLVDPGAFAEVSLFLKPDDFYILRHAYIWTALQRISARHEPIDFVTVQEELRQANRLDDVGGPAYLLHLINSTPTSMHAEVYGRLVQRTAVRRRLLIAADKIKSLALDEQLSVERVLADADKQFAAVRDTSIERESEPFSKLVGDYMQEIEERMLHPEKPVGVPTGFKDLDDLLGGGMLAGELLIIAGRPGMGKTSMLLSIILMIARLGYRVGIASQEMKRQKIIQRFFAMESGINSQILKTGRLADPQWKKFVHAGGALGKLPIYVDDAKNLTPDNLLRKAIRWRYEGGLDLLVVDYLGIMSSGGQFRASERTAEVGYFARSLKSIAGELNIPLIAAAQLNRNLENRQDKRPQLSDLRESGDIEQEADVVQFIYRDSVYNQTTEFPNRADIIVAKQRDGATGTVFLHFEKTTTKYTDQHTRTIDLSTL